MCSFLLEVVFDHGSNMTNSALKVSRYIGNQMSYDSAQFMAQDMLD